MTRTTGWIHRHPVWTLGIAFLFAGVLMAPTYIDQLRRPKIINGPLTFPNSERIENNTDDMLVLCGEAGTTDSCIRLDLDGATPEIQGRNADDAAAAGLQVGVAGQVTTVVGTASFTGGAITMENAETIDTTVDAQFRVTRNTAGIVVFMGADNASPADTTYDTTGAGAIVVGSADVTSVAVTTDGIGDGEFEAPDGSINTDEILDGTVAAADIANSTKTLALPVGAWLDCTVAGGPLPISTDAGADAEPDFEAVASNPVISYDDTGGSIDTNFVCTGFRVPPDWASGGSIFASVTQDAATATIEDIGCTWSLDGGANSAEATAALASQVAIQTVSVTPAGALAAGTVIGVSCRQSDAAPDDIVRIHSLEFRYTATD